MEVLLNNGKNFFTIGVGTYLMKDEALLKEIISESFKIGYRLIDTAQVYRNEAMIGNIMANLKDYGLKRDEIFLTTKLGTSNQGRGNCRKAVLESVKALQVDYIDLVLIHFPGVSKLSPSSSKNSEYRRGSWQDLEELYNEGIVKSIGVSNYTIKHLQEMFQYSQIKPAVNQIEVHPLFYDKSLIDFCKENSIVVQAYSSLGAKDGWPVLSSNETIKQLSEKYNKSVAQILLKWALQHELCIIPKTSRKVNLKPNFELFDFTISSEDMQKIDSLNENRKFCWDPSVVC